MEVCCSCIHHIKQALCILVVPDEVNYAMQSPADTEYLKNLFPNYTKEHVYLLVFLNCCNAEAIIYTHRI